MYIVGILLLCILGVVVGPIDAINSFRNSHIVLGILQIIITLLLVLTMIIVFMVRDYRGDFELDINNEDDARTITLKTAGGYMLGFAVILVVVKWFCQLGNII